MGMYTEIYVNVDLKIGAPDSVIKTLKAMCEHDHESEYLKDKPRRWSYLFASGSFYTPDTSAANLTYSETSRQWSLLGKGDIKNYEGEIEQFFEWLMPYIDAYDGQFIGYKRYEESDLPDLIVKETPND